MERVLKHLPAVLLAVSLSGATATLGRAATLTSYQDEGQFLAAIGTPYTFNDFDDFDPNTILYDQIPGVVFFSPNEGQEGFLPVGAYETVAAKSPPNILGGGSVPGSTEILQVFVMDFKPSIFGIGFYLAAQDPTASPVSVRFEFDDETSDTRLINDRDGKEDTAEFFGFTSDRPIFRVVFTSGSENGGDGGFEEFGIDNLTLTTVEQSPPSCRGTPSGFDLARRIDGTATDDQGFDTGVVSVTLTASSNLTLTCDAPFPLDCGTLESGVPVAMFHAAPADPSLNGSGRIVAIDGAGNSCSLPVTFTAIPAGAVTDENLCALQDGILLNVTGNAPESGIAACSAQLPAPDDPALPGGYEFSPPEDPAACRVLTILSPLSGPTLMTYKKDGTFDPRLRLLFSRYDGTIFPTFTDITESVEPISSLPDPTRLQGTGQYTQVKVACAIQSGVDCSTIDTDGDGYTLCAASGSTTPADCDDRDAAVHPGAAEICDGLDNDCNGRVDDILLFGGYLPPVKQDGSAIFKKGRVVPFKFQLTDCSGALVGTAVATLSVFPYADGIVGTDPVEVSSAGEANMDGLYRYDPVAQQYVYNLSTAGLSSGKSYVVRTTVAGVDHDVIISIR